MRGAALPEKLRKWCGLVLNSASAVWRSLTSHAAGSGSGVSSESETAAPFQRVEKSPLRSIPRIIFACAGKKFGFGFQVDAETEQRGADSVPQQLGNLGSAARTSLSGGVTIQLQSGQLSSRAAGSGISLSTKAQAFILSMAIAGRNQTRLGTGRHRAS